MTFEPLGLSDELLAAIQSAGYTKPTPIQEKAIPIVLMGRDILGCAQTGTGKTASFTLPMLDILGEGRAKARMPRSLILAPTRELATQVADSFDKYGKNHKLSQALLIGGTSMGDQQKKLDRGVDVLIATPGRLLDLFERGKILLADVKILVIDEADRMLDMGFIPDVERIVGMLPPLRQTLFFSATMPKEVRRLADRFLHNPKEVSVDPPDSAAETVTQGLVRCSGPHKRKALQDLLDREEVVSGLIFCNRKRDVAALEKALRKQGHDVGALHGDMSQPERTATLQQFRDGGFKLLVCSDVAARGLDLPAVSHVFNYDVPNHAEDYVHRIGRTGRAGRSGRAVMLATPADAKALDAIQKSLGRAIPPLPLDSVPVLPPDAVEESLHTDTADAPEASGDTAKSSDEKGKRRRGGRRKKAAAPTPPAAEAATPAADTAPAAVAATSAPAAADNTEAEARDSGTAVGTCAGSRRGAAKSRGGAKSASKGDGKGDGKKQVSNGRQSKPFGDHTPAFLLRPVPESATA